jgi:hypothetical protein
MLFVVSGVSCFVHLYSVEYMNGDPHHSRFMSYLSLFTGFMYLLVSADNFIVMFFGWEGIGVFDCLCCIFFFFRRVCENSDAIPAGSQMSNPIGPPKDQSIRIVRNIFLTICRIVNIIALDLVRVTLT